MMTSTLPLGPDDVTAGWLSQVLSTTRAQTRVRSVAHRELIRGAGTKLCLALDYEANPRQLPAILWLKVGWEEHSAAMAQTGAYAREAMFFLEFAPRLNVRAPVCYWAQRDAAGLSGILLEDLRERGADLWTCTVPRSADEVRSLLDGLAAIHAPHWEDPGLLTMPGIDVLIDPTGPVAEWPRESGGDYLRRLLEGPRGAAMPAYTRAGERIERTFWRMVETLDRRNGRCLLHGDPHPGNCFSDADGVSGLYDWQTLTRGPWGHDVGYAVTTALSIEDRRHHERDLLAGYLARLGELGVATLPSFAEAWDDYCRYIAYPLLIWPTNRISHQSEENILALTERLGAAACDFQVFERWGA